MMQKLIEIVGAENFTDQLEELVPYSYDASMNVHRPDAVVWPESTEQVSEIMRFANENRIPVVPPGAGTSLSGGVIPIRGGPGKTPCAVMRAADSEAPSQRNRSRFR